MRKTLVPFAIAAGAVVGFVSAAAAETWNMASGYPDGNYHTKNIRAFIDDVDKSTGGKLKINLHNNQALFKLPQIKHAVQTGQVPIGEILSVQYGNENPLFEMAGGIPFLAPGHAKAAKLWEVLKPYVDDYLAKQGLRLLYVVPWPDQGFYTKTPVSSVADFKGLKFRVYSTMTARLAELMGSSPVTIQFSEVPQAFATGVMHTMITSAQTGIDSQAWDFTKYFTNVIGNHSLNAILVNEAALKKLPADVQNAVIAAGKQAQTRGWKMAGDVNAEQIEFLKTKGMTVAKPSPAFLAELDKLGQALTSEWVKQAGPVGEEIVKKYRQAIGS
ncbi:MAG: TRAP transporter substrate-binding protein [Proteobacteria bacterium]|nr:TRAP transporter substrate-binding protein [Pseudomonadota bacterium]